MNTVITSLTHRRQHTIQHYSSDNTAGLQHKITTLLLLFLKMVWQKLYTREAGIVHFVIAQSHGGGHMFPQQRRNAPAGLLPPLWSHEDLFIEFIAAAWRDVRPWRASALDSTCDRYSKNYAHTSSVGD